MEIEKFDMTMSSKEISLITEKRHDHVLRDCDLLNENYKKLQFPEIRLMFNIRKLPNGGETKDRYYELTRMQTFDLMTGYNTELRIKVNRRWEVLEQQVRSVLPDFTNPALAARAWADEYEKRIALENKVAEDEPKVKLMNDLLHTEDTFSFANAAKIVEFYQDGKLIGRNQLLKFLRQIKILMANNVPYERYVKQGYFQVKTKEVDKGLETPFILTITQLTGRGLAWLIYNRKKWNMEKGE